MGVGDASGTPKRVLMMLLWMSTGVFEEFVDASGEVSLEAATDLAAGLAFSESAGGVGAGLVVTDES